MIRKIVFAVLAIAIIAGVYGLWVVWDMVQIFKRMS